MKLGSRRNGAHIDWQLIPFLAITRTQSCHEKSSAISIAFLVREEESKTKIRSIGLLPKRKNCHVQASVSLPHLVSDSMRMRPVVCSRAAKRQSGDPELGILEGDLFERKSLRRRVEVRTSGFAQREWSAEPRDWMGKEDTMTTQFLCRAIRNCSAAAILAVLVGLSGAGNAVAGQQSVKPHAQPVHKPPANAAPRPIRTPAGGGAVQHGPTTGGTLRMGRPRAGQPRMDRPLVGQPRTDQPPAASPRTQFHAPAPRAEPPTRTLAAAGPPRTDRPPAASPRTQFHAPAPRAEPPTRTLAAGPPRTDRPPAGQPRTDQPPAASPRTQFHAPAPRAEPPTRTLAAGPPRTDRPPAGQPRTDRPLAEPPRRRMDQRLAEQPRMGRRPAEQPRMGRRPEGPLRRRMDQRPFPLRTTAMGQQQLTRATLMATLRKHTQLTSQMATSAMPRTFTLAKTRIRSHAISPEAAARDQRRIPRAAVMRQRAMSQVVVMRQRAMPQAVVMRQRVMPQAVVMRQWPMPQVVVMHQRTMPQAATRH